MVKGALLRPFPSVPTSSPRPQIYSFDPFANLTSSQRHLVLGGEALLWSEQASPENLDSLAWQVPPRRALVQHPTDEAAVVTGRELQLRRKSFGQVPRAKRAMQMSCHDCTIGGVYNDIECSRRRELTLSRHPRRAGTALCSAGFAPRRCSLITAR